MSNRFLVIARVVDDGFDAEDDYSLEFEVDVKPNGMATAYRTQPIQDWFYTVVVPEDLVDQPDDKKDLYKYIQEELYTELTAAFPGRFSASLDKSDILLQGVAGKGEKGEDNGTEWQNYWEQGLPYKKDDVVQHADKVWLCTQTLTLTGNDPGQPGETWAYPPEPFGELRGRDPRYLADVPPNYQFERPKYLDASGQPDAAATSGTLNPARRWDLYVDGPAKMRGAWKETVRYEIGDVVYMSRPRKKGNHSKRKAANEESKSLQFIALKPSRNVNPVDDTLDAPGPGNGYWEVFLDVREQTLVGEWGYDEDGDEMVSGERYFVGDVVTWGNATWVCRVEHEYQLSDVYQDEGMPGKEPDDPAHNEGRWEMLVNAIPNPRGPWKPDPPGKRTRRYGIGDVVWIDKANRDDEKDQELQFICTAVHKPTQANKPSAARVTPGDPDYEENLPWAVFLDLGGLVTGTTDPDGYKVVELVTRDPFVKPKRIPRTAGSDYVLNNARATVPFDATKTSALKLKVDFFDPDYDAAGNGLKVEWWLYAYAEMATDLNKAGAPIWSVKLTGANKAATYAGGTLSLTIVPSVISGTPNYALGHSGGTVRNTTAFALAIKRTAAAGKVEPSHAGKISYAAITVVPVEEES